MSLKIPEKMEAADSDYTSKENVEHLVSKTEPTESANVQNEIQNKLSNICVQTKDTSEQNGSFFIQDCSFNDLMKENEAVKKENEAVKKENEAVKKENEALKKENEGLKKKIETLKKENGFINKGNKAIKEENKALGKENDALSQKFTKHEGNSSFVPESIPRFTSISVENELHIKNDHEILSNCKGMVVTQRDESAVSCTTFDSPTSSAETIPVESKVTELQSEKALKPKQRGKLRTSKGLENETKSSNSIRSFLKDLKKSLRSENTKEIQQQAKDGLQADSNEQKKDPIIMDTALVNNSGKKSTIGEQACLSVENSLGAVIMEDNTSSSIAVESKSTAPQNKRALKMNQRREKHCFKRSETETKSSNSIQSIFKDIDDRLISEAEQNYYVHLLTEFLTDPKNCPDVSALIFCVLEHLQSTTKNYLQAFRNDRANCIFLPSSESCIVSSLFEIERINQTSQFKLIENILITIRHLLILKKHDNDDDGLASLCRVFTELCKRKNDLTKPLSLCADILKMRLQPTAYFIASIAGVWKEPFMLLNNQSDEAMILLGSISLGVGKKKFYPDETLSYSIELITEYFGVPCLPDVGSAIQFLKNKIILNCTRNSCDKLWMLTSSFVILASYKPWEWTKGKLIKQFIVPNLSRFANEEPNETAFAVFCELCVDVYNLKHQLRFEILMKYFRQEPSEGSNFVQEWSAVSLIKYVILNRVPLSKTLLDWIENNKEKSSFEKIKELFLRKNMYYIGLNTISDIIIT